MVNRLALFDLDRTLTDRDAFFRGWAVDFAATHGLPDQAVGFLAELDADGYGDKHVMIRAINRRFGLDLDVGATVSRFYADLTSRHRISRLVREALRVLRRAEWRIGIVTNGSPNQLDKIRAAGLDELVDTAVVSEVEGARKPDPKLFEIAAERAGRPLAGGWMVGDNPEADILGGAGVGLTTAWLALGRDWPTADGQPDHVVVNVPHAVALMLSSDDGLVPLERRAVRGLITDGRGRALLLEVEDPAKPERGRFLVMPGGGIEPGEDDVAALRREVLEETGIDEVDVGPMVLEHTLNGSHIGYPVIQHQRIFHVRVDPLRPRRPVVEDVENDTHVSLRWWTLTELRARQELLRHPQHPILFEILAAEMD
ncbi:MAG TPA: HAD-IA family hydrolase [Nitriliruptorales bacterium]